MGTVLSVRGLVTTGRGRLAVVAAIVVVAMTLTGSLSWWVTARNRDQPTTRSSPPFPSDMVVVGNPAADGGIGAVDVHYRDGSAQRLTPASLGIPVVSGMRFGAAVTVGDLNDDTPSNNDTSGPDRSDLMIGADGGWPKPVTAGGAWILLRSADGHFHRSGVQALAPAGGRDGGFGHSVAISERVRPRDGYVRTGADLWVGAPGTTVDGAPGAGALHRYRLTATGKIFADEVLTQDLAQIPGRAEPGDGFGEVLAATHHGVFVGTPHEDAGDVVDAGVVYQILLGRGTQDLLPSRGFARGLAGVPGPAGAHDLFGASISSDGLMVGIPGATVDGLPGAGAVQELWGATEDVHVGRLIVRGDGAPGRPAAGDRFGSTVTIGAVVGIRVPTGIIGVPGATVSGRPGAGLLSLVSPYSDASLPDEVPPLELMRGAGLPGKPRINESIGAYVGTEGEIRGDDILMIGLPGSPAGGHDGAGLVLMVSWSPGARRGEIPRSGVLGALGGDRDRARFGTALPTWAAP